MIYFDNAATTFPKPDIVLDYVDWVQRNMAVNVGRGSYKVAKEAMRITDLAKQRMGELVHANSAQNVFFTPSATIAANEIIFGLSWDHLKNVYVTPFEHNAIMRPLEMVKNEFGISIHIMPFDAATHELDTDEMERLFKINPPDYVFINQVSNVTGTIVPVKNICMQAHAYGAITIVDGSQSVGLVPIDLRDSCVDYLIFAGHKNLYASWGIGGFVSNTSNLLSPYIAGGTGSDSLNMKMVGYEAGSPNIIAIASLLKSLEWLTQQGIDRIADHKKKLTTMIIDGLNNLGANIYVPANLEKHTSVVSFNIQDYEASEVGIILDQDFDIAVRTGFHCAPLVHKFIGTEDIKGTIRASVGYFNTEEDVRKLLDAIQEI